MKLLYPIGLALLGLIPILILIHSLRPKAKRHVVPNLFLWREVVKDRGGGLRFRKVMANLPLLLQILAVILAAAALADPVITLPAGISGNVILVLDTSAGMKTRTEGGSRFDRARKQALELVDRLPKGAKMLVIEAGAAPMVRAPFTDDKGILRKTIKALEPADVPGRLEKAAYLALSFLNPKQNDTVYMVTDGAGGQYEKIVSLHPRLKWILISGGEKNIGITRFEMRREPGGAGRYEILMEVSNFTSHPVLVPMHLEIDDTTLMKKTVGLAALERKLFIRPYSGLIGGVVQAGIDPADDFSTDNTAYAVLNPQKDIWVLLVSRGNFFLESLLRAYPNFKVNTARTLVASSWKSQVQRHDIVILDRVSPPTIENGNFLLIDAFSPSIPITKTGEAGGIRVHYRDRRHPLTADINISALNIQKASVVRADESLTPLMESPETGLMYAYEKGGLRAVYLGFDLTRSDLPLRVAFPVLMSNIFQWLYADSLGDSSGHVRAGQVLRIPIEYPDLEVTIRPPSGKVERFVPHARVYDLADTGEVGLYSVGQKGLWRYFAVNLQDKSESDIRVPLPEKTAQGPVADIESRKADTEKRLWPLFVFGALALLALEWFVWVRR